MLNFMNKFCKIKPRAQLLAIVRGVGGKPIELDYNLKQRLEEMNTVDPEYHFKVDISLPPPKPVSKKILSERRAYIRKLKNDPKLEKLSRNLKLEPDMEDIKAEWIAGDAPVHTKVLAEHYNIFNDLFGDAYFTPYVYLDIYFPIKDRDLVAPVYRGNVVKPSEALLQPVVKFKSSPDELWTLALVNPDGHFTQENMEYVHWLVGNIPGGDVSKGEVIWDYLPPFPPRGVGFQRFIFVLYKQEKKLDYSGLKKQLPCLELEERSFNTLEFYRQRQDDMTPAGLSFFQSDWDIGSRIVFHEILNMEEPVFEYDFPPQYYNEQTWFPIREPFNVYLDRYRDPQDLGREYLLKELKETDPFSPPKKPFPYPKAAASDLKDAPTWLVKKELYYRMGRGRVRLLKNDEYEK